jgi:hypothetical protein
MEITGTLMIHGRPAGGRVLLYERPGGPLLGATDAGEDGRFAVPLAGPAEGLTLLGKADGAAVGRSVRPSGPVTLDVEAPLHRVKLVLEGTEVPMSVWADPIEIEGVDRALAPFLNQQDHGVFANRFLQRQASGSLELRLAAGRWRVGAYREEDGPARLDVVPERWLATSAREASAHDPLPGDPHGGFELRVDGDRVVTLTVERRT